jgi:hypothetical protein
MCLCSDQVCLNSTQDTICEAFEPVMSDDGSGGDIFIPSFLMLKSDADLVKDEVKKGRMVQVEMSWSLPVRTFYVSCINNRQRVKSCLTLLIPQNFLVTR